MECSIKFDKVIRQNGVLRQDGPLYFFEGLQVINLKRKRFLSLKIDFVLANSADPDEMPPCPHCLGPHCLSKYPFRGFGALMG